jgi:hypothetical protein
VGKPWSGQAKRTVDLLARLEPRPGRRRHRRERGRGEIAFARRGSGVTGRQVGRMTIVERPDALIVTAPFLPRRRAALLLVATIGIFVFLEVFAFGGPAPRRSGVIGMVLLFGVCGYVALILALNGTITTVRRDRIMVRRGPVPMWPATVIDPARIEEVRAAVVTGVVGRGGRMALDSVVVSLVRGPTVTIIDDAGDAAAAEHVAATVTAWLWSRIP